MMNNKLQAETAADSITTDARVSDALLAQNPMLADAVFKPMLFSTPMVQAILEGRKTMTRRILKAGFDLSNKFYRNILKLNSKPFDCQAYFSDTEISRDWLGIKCPFEISNIIWVRETFYAYGNWEKDGLTKKGKQKYKFVDFTKDNFSFEDFDYKYEDCKPQRIVKGISNKIGWYKRSSLFMPKKACRLFLEVTNVNVERIQYISEIDAINEGIEKEQVECDTYWSMYPTYGSDRNSHTDCPKEGFKGLWYKINGEQSWEDNPFVWVYTFKVVECPYGFR